MIKIFLCVVLFSLPAYTYWANRSYLLTNPKQPQQNTAQTKPSYAVFVPGQEMIFKLEDKNSCQWFFYTDAQCTVSIYMNITLVHSTVLDKGKTQFKQFLEPGNYNVVTTAAAQGKLLLWKERKMKALAPLGGGCPVYITHSNRQLTYYRISRDTVPVLKIKGPTVAYVFIRADVPVQAQKETLDIVILDKENNKKIARKSQSVRKSQKATYLDLKNVVPSTAAIITLIIPEGIRHYEVIGTPQFHGSVKFYRKPKTTPSLQKKQGTYHKDFPDPFSFRLSLTTMAQYDNNIYAFCRDKIDSFPPSVDKQFKYPGVRSVEDWSAPVGGHVYFRANHFKTNLYAKGELFAFNHQLNQVKFGASAGMDYGVYLGCSYQYSPSVSVRPTYAGNLLYRLFEYRYNRWSAECRVHTKISPSFGFAFATYRFDPFGTAFTMYNADLYEGTIGIKRKEKLFSYDGTFSVGSLRANPDTNVNWSNIPVAVEIGLNFRILSWDFGLTSGLKERFYVTKDKSDSYFDRKDLSGTAAPYCKYTWKFITGVMELNDSWRTVNSPDETIADTRSYNSFSIKLGIIWKFSLI